MHTCILTLTRVRLNTCTHARKLRWSAYMQLVAASLSSMVKDNGLQRHLTLVKEVQVRVAGWAVW